MIRYKIRLHSFSKEWEDFWPENTELPMVTIRTAPEKIPLSDEFSAPVKLKVSGKWIVVYVKESVTMEIARKVLANLNSCQPEDIDIYEGN
ncbi:hypothetical protein KKC32_02430 [Patescibacteria group bacterium]|nr:hypothetical protein [Patescibacteria group bacterium]